MNILDRKFVELDSKHQIEFNRQKNVQQDQKLSTLNQTTISLQEQVAILATGKVSNYLPLVWARDATQYTYRLESIGEDWTSVANGIYQLVPQGAPSNSYISAIVEKTETAYNILLPGDYQSDFTALTLINVNNGAQGDTKDVNLSLQVSSYLYQYDPTENAAARVKVMHDDNDGATREYTSVDYNGDGTYSWIRYGTINNGVDGKSIFEVNQANWANIREAVPEDSVLFFAETFNDGYIQFNKGDVGYFRPSLGREFLFTADGNINGEKGDTGDTGATGPKGNKGFTYLATGTYNNTAVPTPGQVLFVEWSDLQTGILETGNMEIAESMGDAILVKIKNTSTNIEYIASGKITAVPPVSPTNKVQVVLATVIASTGEQGNPGNTGADGVSITNVTSTKNNRVTTVTVTLSSGSSSTFQIKDGENAVPFVIAQGIYTLATLPTYATAASNTGYVVLNTSPPVNTYDLYIKSGEATDWTVVPSWGGVQGPQGTAGQDALTVAGTVIHNETTLESPAVPTTTAINLTSMNRIPNVGDVVIFMWEVYHGSSPTPTYNFYANGTVTSVNTGSGVAIVQINSRVLIGTGPQGTPGADGEVTTDAMQTYVAQQIALNITDALVGGA